MELVEDQLGAINANCGNNNTRKKGNTAKEILFGNNANGVGKDYSANGHTAPSLTKKAKLIKIEEIRKIVKKTKIWILQNLIPLEEFLKTKILNWK